MVGILQIFLLRRILGIILPGPPLERSANLPMLKDRALFQLVIAHFELDDTQVKLALQKVDPAILLALFDQYQWWGTSLARCALQLWIKQDEIILTVLEAGLQKKDYYLNNENRLQTVVLLGPRAKALKPLLEKIVSKTFQRDRMGRLELCEEFENLYHWANLALKAIEPDRNISTKGWDKIFKRALNKIKKGQSFEDLWLDERYTVMFYLWTQELKPQEQKAIKVALISRDKTDFDKYYFRDIFSTHTIRYHHQTKSNVDFIEKQLETISQHPDLSDENRLNYKGLLYYSQALRHLNKYLESEDSEAQGELNILAGLLKTEPESSFIDNQVIFGDIIGEIISKIESPELNEKQKAELIELLAVHSDYKFYDDNWLFYLAKDFIPQLFAGYQKLDPKDENKGAYQSFLAKLLELYPETSIKRFELILQGTQNFNFKLQALDFLSHQAHTSLMMPDKAQMLINRTLKKYTQKVFYEALQSQDKETVMAAMKTMSNSRSYDLSYETKNAFALKLLDHEHPEVRYTACRYLRDYRARNEAYSNRLIKLSKDPNLSVRVMALWAAEMNMPGKKFSYVEQWAQLLEDAKLYDYMSEEGIHISPQDRHLILMISLALKKIAYQKDMPRRNKRLNQALSALLKGGNSLGAKTTRRTLKKMGEERLLKKLERRI